MKVIVHTPLSGTNVMLLPTVVLEVLFKEEKSIASLVLQPIGTSTETMLPTFSNSIPAITLSTNGKSFAWIGPTMSSTRLSTASSFGPLILDPARILIAASFMNHSSLLPMWLSEDALRESWTPIK